MHSKAYPTRGDTQQAERTTETISTELMVKRLRVNLTCAPQSEKVLVRIIVPFRVAFGQVIKVRAAKKDSSLCHIQPLAHLSGPI